MAQEEQSVGQLVASASRDLSTLIRAEIELTKLELRADVKAAATGGAMFGAAGVVGVMVVILLSIAAAYGLTAAGLHPALAFLVVAVAYGLAAGALVFLGVRKVKQVGPPERTIATTKETAAALRGNNPPSIPPV
jgi:hypothetical protein